MRLNNSESASEFLLRATRTLKESKLAFDEGDLLYTAIRLYETVENLSKVIMSLYGVYTRSDKGNALALNYVKRSRQLDQKTSSLIEKLQEIEAKLYPSIMIDEASLKTPSVVIRHKEAEILLNQITNLFDEVNVIFDEFHN